jgi:hypothetical protein
MAINQNHLFEELNGVKCAIVEKNVSPARVEFLRGILEYNRYTVVVVPSPPPKAAAGAVAGGTVGASAAPAAGIAASAASAGGPGSADTTATAPAPALLPPAPETFTVGVTDVMFNAVNAVFGRLLKTPGGHIVTLAYWRQQENEPNDEKPYFGGR